MPGFSGGSAAGRSTSVRPTAFSRLCRGHALPPPRLLRPAFDGGINQYTGRPTDRPTDRPGPVRRPQISRPTPGREITRSPSHPSHRRPSRRLRGTHRRRLARPLNRLPWKFQRNDNGDGRPGARDRCHAVVDVRTPCPLISITISTSTGTDSVTALRWTGVQSGGAPCIVRARYGGVQSSGGRR